MLSIPHLIIIFVVALVVFGPEKLPDLARNLGKIMGEFRRATGDLRSTFEGHMRDLEREAEQRKIAAPAATPAAQAADAAALSESTTESPTNTVPTTPLHGAASEGVEGAEKAGAAEDEFPSQLAETTSVPLESPVVAEPSEPKSEPENQTETVSDGGTRPA